MDSGSNNSQVKQRGHRLSLKKSRFQRPTFRLNTDATPAQRQHSNPRGGTIYHGSAFEFLRNDKLYARNFFSPLEQSCAFNNSAGTSTDRSRKQALLFRGPGIQAYPVGFGAGETESADSGGKVRGFLLAPAGTRRCYWQRRMTESCGILQCSKYVRRPDFQCGWQH